MSIPIGVGVRRTTPAHCGPGLFCFSVIGLVVLHVEGVVLNMVTHVVTGHRERVELVPTIPDDDGGWRCTSHTHSGDGVFTLSLHLFCQGWGSDAGIHGQFTATSSVMSLPVTSASVVSTI